ncbi:MAG: hypothetical protein O2812_04535 [Chloroflexi bacterium]|nr:hypothetical protein [Chloroflexota bacterium]
MNILDYTDTVKVTGPDGDVHPGHLDGIIEQGLPHLSVLGHGELLLARQRWVNAKLIVQQALSFTNGTITFSDGSSCNIMLQPAEVGENGYTHKATLDIT